MKRPAAAAILSLLVGVVVALGAAPAGASTPYCGIRWGSLPKDRTLGAGAQLINIRAGRHACFDRLVIDLRGGRVAYSARYVKQVHEDPSDRLVPLRGGARLQIAVFAADQDANYRPTYRPAQPSELVNLSGFRTFRQVAAAGGFEGVTSIGLGVRARLPFRVFLLDGPAGHSRMVVDVAHRW